MSPQLRAGELDHAQWFDQSATAEALGVIAYHWNPSPNADARAADQRIRRWIGLPLDGGMRRAVSGRTGRRGIRSGVGCAIIVALLALAGCASPRAASVEDAKRTFADVTCSFDTAMSTYLNNDISDLDGVHAAARTVRGALAADARALAREEWPAPVSADVAQVRVELVRYVADLDAFARSTTLVRSPWPTRAFTRTVARVQEWFSIGRPTECAGGPSTVPSSDNVPRATYLAATCLTNDPLTTYSAAALADQSQLVAHAKAAAAALRTYSRMLSQVAVWPDAVAESISILQDWAVGYATSFDEIAGAGQYIEDPVAPPVDSGLLDRMTAWFGIDWRTECPG